MDIDPYYNELRRRITSLQGIDMETVLFYRGLMYYLNGPSHKRYPNYVVHDAMITLLSCPCNNSVAAKAYILQDILPVHKDTYGNAIGEKLFREYPEMDRLDMHRIILNVPSIYQRARAVYASGYAVLMDMEAWDFYMILKMLGHINTANLELARIEKEPMDEQAKFALIRAADYPQDYPPGVSVRAKQIYERHFGKGLFSDN